MTDENNASPPTSGQPPNIPTPPPSPPIGEPDPGSDTKIYTSEKQILEAARQIGQKNTRLSQRQRIMKSLRQSGVMASASVPVLLDSYRAQEPSGRHDILDFLSHLLDTGADLTPHADALGIYLNETNTALREKVTTLLVRMGPAAQAAETAALGCSRNALREIRLAGLRVLTAIGRACSPSTVARLQALLAATPSADAEMREAIEGAIAAASGTARQALDPAEAEVREKVKAMLSAVARRDLTPQIHTELRRRLESITPRLRLRALFSCFSLHEPSVRAAAAILLQDYRRHLEPFIPIIARAFRVETDRSTKEHIGALLSAILHEQRQRQTQPTVPPSDKDNADAQNRRLDDGASHPPVA